MNKNKSSLFTKKELFFYVKALILFKGGSSYLARIFSRKLQQMRSKKEKKRQTKLLHFIKLFFTYLFKYNVVFIRGIKFSIKGRLNGSLRKKKWIFSKGKNSLHQLDTKMDFFFCSSQTSYGSFGIKIWINYGKI